MTETMTPEDLLSGKSSDADAAQTATARAALALAEPGDATLPARHRWDAAQVEVIRGTVAKDCNPHELAMFLEVAARYGLDPFAREIFAAKFDGTVTIFTGRDGHLKVAKQSGELVRMASGVVRENDTYEVETVIDPDEGEERIQRFIHKYAGIGTEKRGKIIGAWALVWRKGQQHPWFAEAAWEDYGEKKQKTSNGKDTLWTVGKGTPEAMMIKVPETIALRKAFGLSGLYGREELPLESDEGQPIVGEGAPPSVQWPDGWLGEDLRELVDAANRLVPNSWREPKVAVNVNGKPEADLLALRTKLIRFISSRDREGIVDGVMARQRAREGIVDATAVEEAEDQPAATDVSEEPPDDPQLDEQGEGELPGDRAQVDMDADQLVERDALRARQVKLAAVVADLRAELKRTNGDATTLEGDTLRNDLQEAEEHLAAVNARAVELGLDEVSADDEPPQPPVEYDRERHELIAGNVRDLAAALGDADGEEADQLQSDLEAARLELARLNDVAEAAGEEPIGW